MADDCARPRSQSHGLQFHMKRNMENPAKYLSSVQGTDSVPAPQGDMMWNSTETKATGDDSKDMLLRTVTGCLLSLLILWTLLGNILVCSAVLRFRHLRTKLNWHKATDDMAGAHNFSTSLHLEENCDSSLSREYAISSSLISFYIPVAIMIVTYTRIYRIAQIQIRRIASLERAAEHAQSCRTNRIECQHHNTLKTLLGCRYFCSNTPVETVNISNELVSYNQDTLIHKEIANAYVNMIPNVVECIEHEETFDRISQFSHNNDNATDSVCDLEDCEADISLDRMSPFTPNGLH
ncbi:D(1B) dopamine receptor [Solea senegalensis]|uniref:D(1B) dopamine receptor n=1 Tax=Solea senegalensis TaxID=28829 RepID=A0AAV6QQF0_SOLSE|nr:D(1B) dopamine receptor [Solea senegalensis]